VGKIGHIDNVEWGKLATLAMWSGENWPHWQCGMRKIGHIGNVEWGKLATLAMWSGEKIPQRAIYLFTYE
jgi:hypothetical protein